MGEVKGLGVGGAGETGSRMIQQNEATKTQVLVYSKHESTPS